MERCKTCKFWKQDTFYENVLNSGLCKKIPDYNKIVINIQTGWDGGYIDNIETEEDFGCTLYEPNS